ncbi:hypothetical protein EYF80_024388 [Liparis tanakae]|uniref:Uncharacterized protein n=1 Tax=Liparis tanakae TaxID=230148 RepID=A0A4Z2HKF4_9TELE|nr:hypothetical protein EYF80_024388 [Liparis tanakae]
MRPAQRLRNGFCVSPVSSSMVKVPSPLPPLTEYLNAPSRPLSSSFALTARTLVPAREFSFTEPLSANQGDNFISDGRVFRNDSGEAVLIKPRIVVIGVLHDHTIADAFETIASANSWATLVSLQLNPMGGVLPLTTDTFTNVGSEHISPSSATIFRLNIPLFKFADPSDLLNDKAPESGFKLK